MPRLATIVEPLLTTRRVMRQQFARLHKMLLDVVRHDPLCRQPMTAPGVGAVGAHVGHTPQQHQAGEIDYGGGISKSGNALLRTMLYEAAQILLPQSRNWSWLRAWGMRVVQRRSMRRAIVAVARRLIVILHRMWTNGTDFRWGSEPRRRLIVHTKSSTVLPRQKEVLTGTKVV